MEIHIVWLGGSRMWIKPPNQKRGNYRSGSGCCRRGAARDVIGNVASDLKSNGSRESLLQHGISLLSSVVGVGTLGIEDHGLAAVCSSYAVNDAHYCFTHARTNIFSRTL
jgi:hypothetical protein